MDLVQPAQKAEWVFLAYLRNRIPVGQEPTQIQPGLYWLKEIHIASGLSLT